MCYGSFQSGCDYVSWQFIRKSLKNKYLKSQRDNGGKSFFLLHNRHKKENRLNMLIVFFQTSEMQAKILCPKNISAESRHKKGLKQGSSLSQCFTFKEMVLSEFLHHTTKYSLYSLIYLVNIDDERQGVHFQFREIGFLAIPVTFQPLFLWTVKWHLHTWSSVYICCHLTEN